MSHWTDTVPLATLTHQQLDHLWRALHHDQLVSGPDPDLTTISQLTHTDVVLSLADDPTEIGMDIMEILLQKSIYLAARGETGEPLTDTRGRPLPTPIGHRRGETPTRIWASREVMSKLRNRNSRRDNRIIVSVGPNPKDPGRAAWHRYNHYTVGISVEELLETTPLTRADVRWDLRQGHVVAAPPVYATQIMERSACDSSQP